MTGGKVKNEFSATTELYLWGDTQWKGVAPLPTAREGVSGVTLGNKFFVTGLLSISQANEPKCLFLFRRN